MNSHGNVIFIIFIAIALFAALSYTVSQSMRGSGTQQFSSEQGKLIASEIMSYGNALQQAYQAVRLNNGCSEDEIATEHPGIPVGGFAALSPRGDFICHLFYPEGGGLDIPQRNLEWTYAPPAPQAAQQGYFLYRNKKTEEDIITGGNDPATNIGVGTAAYDIMLQLNFVNESICTEFNRLNGITGIPVDDGEIRGDDDATLSGKRAYCAEDASGHTQIRYVYDAR